MKILFGLPEKTARGGINACEPPFLDDLKKRGINFREEIYSFDNADGISLAGRISNVIKTAKKFRRILRDEKFDVFHINTAFDKKALLRDGFITSFLGTTNTSLFLKFHGSDEDLLKNEKFLPLLKLLVKRAAGIGVLSYEEKRNFTNAGFPAAKFYVVKNAVTISTNENLPRDFIFHENNPMHLLFVSRLIKTKGLIETIQAFSKISENVILDVLGDGEIKSEAENLAKNLNLDEKINFHGHVSEQIVGEFYKKSDVLVFPTYHQEGFPMVIFNAMANGLPIITTRIRAAADYLNEPENSLWTNPKDADDLAEKIKILYHDANLIKTMSDNNFKLAREFTAEKIAPEYLEIYKKLSTQQPL